MRYATLVWVKPTIDDTLKLTRQSLEQFVENPDDTTTLQKSVGWLKEIRGALVMLNINSAVLLMQSVEMVVQAILDGKINNKEQAYDSLMRSLIQLPNYLEHLALGYADIPMAILPSINKLRSLVGQKPLQSSQLFFPDLNIPLPVKAAPHYPDNKLKQFVQQKRIAFQKGLQAWLQAKNIAGLKLLLSTAEQLTQVTGKAPISRIWWITAAILESVAQKGLPANAALVSLIKQMDSLMKLVVARGNLALHVAPPERLLGQLLFYAAHSKSRGPRLQLVHKTYHLGYCFPNQALLQSSMQVFAGPDTELMGTIVDLMREDFVRIEETLDIFMRADNPDHSDLLPLIEIMRNMAYTLLLLGMNVQAKLMLKQTQLLKQIGEGHKSYDLAGMLEVANDLLNINAALDTLASRGTHARQQIQQEEGLLETQFKDVLVIAVSEAKMELAEMIPLIMHFFDKEEVNEEFEEIPARFDRIMGLFNMLERSRAQKLVGDCRLYIQKTMIEAKIVPDENKRKALADAIISLELYLDTVAGNPLDDNQILDTTHRCLAMLKVA